MAYKRILVPVDGSAVSHRGLKEAIKLAREWDARLRLFHVVAEYAAYANAEVSVDIGPILDSLRKQGERTLAKVKARARNVRFESGLAENPGGRIADTIVDEAKRWRADLIVMGTHGRRGLRRFVLGSVAQEVVATAPCPVVTVRMKEPQV